MNYIPLCRKCHMAYDPRSGHRVPHTEEARAKMSASQRRRHGTEDTPRVKPVKGEPRVGANPFQSGKTHCPMNHEYDEANTYYAPDGTRGCKECRREHTRKWRAAQKAKRQEPDAA